MDVPIGAAIAALIYATRGEAEIYRSDGRLGGVAFARAARIIAILVLAAMVVALLLLLVTSSVVDVSVP